MVSCFNFYVPGCHQSGTSFCMFINSTLLFCELPVDTLNPFFKSDYLCFFRLSILSTYFCQILPKQTQFMALLCSKLPVALSRICTTLEYATGPCSVALIRLWAENQIQTRTLSSSSSRLDLRTLNSNPKDTQLAQSQASSTHHAPSLECLPPISTFHLNATFSAILLLSSQLKAGFASESQVKLYLSSGIYYFSFCHV